MLCTIKIPLIATNRAFFTTLDDLVPADHPVRMLDMLVDTMIAQHPEEFQYKGQYEVGQKAYSPATHHTLLLSGYLNGITSSRKRASVVEHVFGRIRYWMGQIPLLLRGEDKVQTGIDLYTTAYNFKRLLTIEGVGLLLWKMSQGAWATS